jgi:hypothetical protein
MSMLDNEVLLSLVVLDEGPNALRVNGCANLKDLMVSGRALFCSIDLTGNACIGGDSNVCGYIRCDKMFHLDECESQIIWRFNLVSDTKGAVGDGIRHDIGSESRPWENGWIRRIIARRVKAVHIVSEFAKIDAIESSSVVTDNLCAQNIVNTFDGELLVSSSNPARICKQVTFLKPNSQSSEVSPTITLDPHGPPGSRLELVALESMRVKYGDTIISLKKLSHAIIFNRGSCWTLYS